MANAKSPQTNERQRRSALSRWENEGGAQVRHGGSSPDLTNAELVQLRIRVIALENLVIALLAKGSEGQRASIREMAKYISPRPGYTEHPLTLQAADQMVHLADRAAHFQEVKA